MELRNYNITTEFALRLKEGEKKAFQQLFEQFGPKIYHFALSLLKNNEEAEELVQDVFLKLWEKKENLNPQQNVRSFIFKIVVNAIYDLVKKKNLEKAFSDFSKYNFNESADSTWHEIIWKEMLSQFNQTVLQMPVQQQKIFRLSKEENLSNDEIAEKLNLSKRTVENQLYRAIQFLKRHLKTDSIFLMLFLSLYC